MDDARINELKTKLGEIAKAEIAKGDEGHKVFVTAAIEVISAVTVSHTDPSVLTAAGLQQLQANLSMIVEFLQQCIADDVASAMTFAMLKAMTRRQGDV